MPIPRSHDARAGSYRVERVLASSGEIPELDGLVFEVVSLPAGGRRHCYVKIRARDYWKSVILRVRRGWKEKFAKAMRTQFRVEDLSLLDKAQETADNLLKTVKANRKKYEGLI